MSDEVRIKRERILLAKIEERYTEEQMNLWGQFNAVVGCVIITTVQMIMLLLGAPPMSWFWQGLLLVILAPVGYLYYRQYKQTRGRKQ